MAVDYLSTLNTKGSGINITQLVDSLVQAETEPKKALVQDKLDKETVSISEMTKLRSELVALSTVLSTGDTGQSYSLTSSDSSVGVAVTDYTKVTAVTSSVDVNTLASSQVLEFGNFTSSTAVLSPPANTNLSAAYASGGTNSTQPTFAVSGGGTTAASLAVSGADSTFEVGDVHNITVDGVTIPVTMTSSETNATTAATKIRDTINTWAAAHSDATSLYVATTDGSTINLVKKDAITLSFGTWSGSGFARKATTASGAASNTTRYTASLGNSVAGDTITVVTGGLTVAATVGATDSATLSNLQTALATAAAAASTPITTYSVAATSTAGSFEFTDSGSTNMSASATASGVTATKAITLAASATVSDFATALNALTGVSASIVNKGSGTYSLVVKSSTGVSNALSIASTSGNFTTTAQSSGLASQQIVAASDAAFTVDGVSLTREINVVSDLFDGATITLNSVTAAGSVVSISGTEKVALAQVEITAFVAYINEVRSTLTELTKRGLNGADPGALAGDLTANTIKQKLSRLTTEPIVGFGDTAIYLSDLGVETERDGSLSLDATTFKNSFALDPSKYKAIFQSKIATSISGFTGKTTSYANITPGVYDLTYNSATDAVSIGDVNFITSASTGFDTNYYSTNAAYLGLTLSAGVGDAATAKLYVGKSLKDKVTAYIDKLMATTGDFTTRETKLVSEKTKYETEITDLEAAALVIEARYIEKFTAMEQMVTKFKNTGEYLTTMMDAWVNQK